MIQEVTMYRVVCDRCGASPESDYWAWSGPNEASAEADESNWLCDEHPGGHWCPDCTEWDDELDARLPKPPKSHPQMFNRNAAEEQK